MLRAALLIVGLSVAGLGCDGSPASPSDVIGATWALTSLRGAGSSTAIPVSDPSRYQVTFEAGGNLGVTSDCNRCSGSYTLSGASLSITPLGCTRVFCGETSLDSRFSTALQMARSVDVDGDVLTIEGGGATLRFRKR